MVIILTGDVVFLPGEHDLWGAVVSCRNISCHLRILNTGQTKIANLRDKSEYGTEFVSAWSAYVSLLNKSSSRNKKYRRTLRSQFSFTRMLLGFYNNNVQDPKKRRQSVKLYNGLHIQQWILGSGRLTKSRWTTPAEWRYLRPRYWTKVNKEILELWVPRGLERNKVIQPEIEWTYQDLVEEVLDELLVQGSRSQEAVQVRSKQFCDKVAEWFHQWEK